MHIISAVNMLRLAMYLCLCEMSVQSSGMLSGNHMSPRQTSDTHPESARKATVMHIVKQQKENEGKYNEVWTSTKQSAWSLPTNVRMQHKAKASEEV